MHYYRMAQTQTITETRGSLERARSTIKNMKLEGQRVTRLATHGVLMAAGGAVSGFLRVNLPVVPGTDDVATDVVLGSGLMLAATLDLGGSMSDEMLAIGGGMVAASTADYVEKQFRKTGKKK